ncbi:replication protein P [Gallibacterium anatis]|uniref:replication protein P n=1 Tax=Gallibacterium anatis TaxID=750 RepID=UPI00068BBF21|nr:replication protein P [Gallibacterium anatis]
MNNLNQNLSIAVDVRNTAQNENTRYCIERIVNDLFKKLAASCPVLLTRTEEQLNTLKKQWIYGFVENGINTIEQIQDGMKAVRAKENSYLPSVGEFIAYCKQGERKRLGLPDEVELKHRLNKFRANGGFYNIDYFEFISTAEYWLITEIANDSRQKEYTEAEENAAIKEALEKMANRLKSGFKLPNPVRTIAKESTVRPYTPQEIARFFNRPELKF